MKPGAYRSSFDLAGRIALVTGGAGILGRHFCAGLADAGASVAVVDIDGAAAAERAREIAAAFKGKTAAVACDLTQPAAVTAMVAEVGAKLGPPDVLVNNAATKGSDLAAFFAPPESASLDTWREVMATNLDAMFLVAQAVGSGMADRGRGSIVQIASIYGVLAPDARIYEGSEYQGRPINTPPVYAASKAGVVGLTRYLAAHWAARGVRVNTLSPGGVQSGQNRTFVDRYAGRVPMGRMARAEELVGALLFLASDASSYVTGQNIVVDGGLSAW